MIVEENPNIVDLTEENFEAEVLKTNDPVLVDFYATWCGPCAVLAPTIDEIAEEMVGKIKVCRVNTDDCPHLAATYGIFSIPTIIGFKYGQERNRTIGVCSKEYILTLVK